MDRQESRFAACHPAVCFLFFTIAIVSCVLIQHPAYVAVSFFAAAVLLCSLRGARGISVVLAMVPLFLVVSVVNPLFNTAGEHVLTTVFGRPYTLEALCYGMVMAGMVVAVLLWFSCYNLVMTSDKFTCLFGNLIPALSLILVMVLRLVPSYGKKAEQISGARRCIGRAATEGSALRQRISGGMMVLSALTSWSLEGAVITADSMRSRGYGMERRTSFQIYHMTAGDWALGVVMAVLLMLTAAWAAVGFAAASFTPSLEVTPVSGISAVGLTAYGTLLLIPSLINLWETIKWQFFQSKI